MIITYCSRRARRHSQGILLRVVLPFHSLITTPYSFTKSLPCAVFLWKNVASTTFGLLASTEDMGKKSDLLSLVLVFGEKKQDEYHIRWRRDSCCFLTLINHCINKSSGGRDPF